MMNMSISMRLEYNIDLNAPLVTQAIPTQLVEGDQRAHTLVLNLLRGREPADLGGMTATAYFKRPVDNVVVACPGVIEGSTATIPLDASCYKHPGIATLIVRLGNVSEETERSVLRLAGPIESASGSGVIDPSGFMPTPEAVAQLFTELERAITALTAAAEAAGEVTEAATEAAGSANDAAEAANAAAENATEKAGLADAAAQRIDGMTASAARLQPGAQPTAEITEEDGVKHIAFGIPKGDTGAQGIQGERGYSGNYPLIANAADTDVTLEMLANTDYVYSAGLTTLTLTFGAALEDYTTEYRVRFVSGDAAPVVMLPASVVWSPAAPVFEPAHSYELSFTPMGGGYMGVWTALEVA